MGDSDLAELSWGTWGSPSGDARDAAFTGSSGQSSACTRELGGVRLLRKGMDGMQYAKVPCSQGEGVRVGETAEELPARQEEIGR